MVVKKNQNKTQRREVRLQKARTMAGDLSGDTKTHDKAL